MPTDRRKNGRLRKYHNSKIRNLVNCVVRTGVQDIGCIRYHMYVPLLFYTTKNWRGNPMQNGTFFSLGQRFGTSKIHLSPSVA